MSHSSTGLRVGFALSTLALLGACASTGPASRVASAKTALLGFSEQDVRMCAGFPQEQLTENGVTTWSYRATNSESGLSLSAPLWIANTNLKVGGGGYCRAQFQFEGGHLTGLAYAGDSDSAQGRDALCAPIVNGCLAYARDRARP
ncbi:hypothetical protein GCM10011390_30430 [Aureimonas endophytica]|uniref:Lipoprotein n=1 Tax=Aureimonas endophytica TaxID=2027858 RepID=A0A916ZRD8_9HYPH|nr:hypothetical protein [Aureimonas endophytica]GGE09239.1 hypothetical protein GCM10011390_30430 [Aureimonas endophytica]